MKRLQTTNISLGSDPELFFSTKEGNTLESIKVLEKEKIGGSCDIAVDGVQVELHPSPVGCRAFASNEIRRALERLKMEYLDKKGIKINFSEVVKLSPEEMAALTENSKKFGCMPSMNGYTRAKSVITVDPSVYPYRSAGGHLHVSGSQATIAMQKMPELTARVMDIIVGNTFVMIDKDPAQVERRKVYGKAGEYRLPRHGFEYRTLSNCWMKSNQLMSFAYGLARLAATIVFNIWQDEKDNKKDAPKKLSEFRKLLRLVKKADIIRAINTNDFNLAKANWDKIKDYIAELTSAHNGYYDTFPFRGEDTIQQFDYFVSKGIEYWFKEDILTHWCTLPEGHGVGWEDFLANEVKEDMATGKFHWHWDKDTSTNYCNDFCAKKLPKYIPAMPKVMPTVAT